MAEKKKDDKTKVKPKKKKRGKSNNSRMFIILLFTFAVLMFFAIRLTKVTDSDIREYHLVKRANAEAIEQTTSKKPQKTDIKSLLSKEQVRRFAEDFGIKTELVKFIDKDKFSEVHLPVNFSSVDLNYTNYCLTKFVYSLRWKQKSGTESANQNLQILTFTAPQDKVEYQFRIYYDRTNAYPVTKSKIVIIVKGFGGFKGKELDRWLDLNEDICYSVLPIDRHSRANILQIVRSKHEALIEIPMEDPGFPTVYTPEYAIFANFKDSEVSSKLDSYFRLLPNASGTITNQGGLVTTDVRIMRVILNYVKKRNIYFIDDKAIETSIAFEVAQQLMVNSFEKTITFNPANYRNDTNNSKLLSDLKSLNRHHIIATLQRPDDDTFEFVKRLVRVAEGNGYEITRISSL